MLEKDIGSVWILLLNWKNAKDTIECLQSICDSSDAYIQGIVVCDNGSDDGSLEDLQSWFAGMKLDYQFLDLEDGMQSVCGDENNVEQDKQFVLIANGANLGFAGGNNVGLDFIKQYTDYDYVFVLNNDTLIEADTVSSSVKHFQTNKNMGLCGSKVVYEHSRHLVQAYGGAKFNPLLGRAVNIGSMASSEVEPDGKEIEGQLDYILGAAMMVSKECLEAIGNMEDQYFLFYEEIDWATRAKRAGFELGFAKDSIVFHKEGASIGSSYDKANRSLIADYYLVSSRIKFTHKFYPYYLPSVYAFCLFQAFRNLLRMDVKRFKVILKAVLQQPLAG